MKSNKFKLISLILLLIGAIGAYYAYSEYNRTAVDTENLTVELKADAISLLTEFESDEAAANAKYLDKVVSVTGIITASVKDSLITVYLGSAESISGISCELLGDKNYTVDQFKVGTEVVITGLCSGYLTDVVMRRAIVESN